MEEPPSSLPVQATNFESHLLSYNKAFINQLLGSIPKNTRALAIRTDFTPFRPYVRAAVRIFSRIDRAIGEKVPISAQWKYGCFGLVVSITLIA